MASHQICGPCSTYDHDRCHDGLIKGVLGGWICVCKHTEEEDAKRKQAWDNWFNKFMTVR